MVSTRAWLGTTLAGRRTAAARSMDAWLAAAEGRPRSRAGEARCDDRLADLLRWLEAEDAATPAHRAPQDRLLARALDEFLKSEGAAEDLPRARRPELRALLDAFFDPAPIVPSES